MEIVYVMLFRHAEAYSPDGIINGFTANNPLTQKGHNQAIELGNAINFLNFDLICSSDSCRALDTAKHAVKSLLDKIIVRRAFREMHFGVFENKPFNFIEVQAIETQNQMTDILNPNTFKAKFEGGESHCEVRRRVEGALKEQIKANPDARQVALFTHGAVLTCIHKFHKLEWKKSVANTESLILKYNRTTDEFFM